MKTNVFKSLVKVYAIGVLGWMLWMTTQASLKSNVVEGFKFLFQDDWGTATLSDAYFTFYFVWFWMAYRTKSWAGKIASFIAVTCLGSIAIALYVLWALKDSTRYAKSDDEAMKVFFLGKQG